MTASSLRVLTADPDAPIVTETTMETATLHTFHVLTKNLVEEVGILLAGLAVLDIALTIEHPSWDLELQWIADDSNDLIDFIGRELSCALVQVDVTLFANEVREPPPDPLDGRERVHDLLSSIHVGVAHSQDMLEILRLELYRHPVAKRAGELSAMRTVAWARAA